MNRTDTPTVHHNDGKTTEGRIAGSLEDDARTHPDSYHSLNIPILSDKVVNVASVPQRSPLRYPGGKTWLVPEIRKWLNGLEFRPSIFVEPYAGGGIASLTAVMDGYVDKAVLCEKDPELSNLWQCLIDDSEQLAQRVENFVPTIDSVRTVIADTSAHGTDAGFRTLLRNRINRGGIIAKGASMMRQGENNHGIASRWYPDTLASRIRTIGVHAAQFSIFQGDGAGLVELCQDNRSAAFFVDPPYTAAGKRAGKRLYTHNQIDHEELFDRMSSVSGTFMMTYDESPEVIELARSRRFHLAKVAMKNTHHAVMYELLITSHKLTP